MLRDPEKARAKKARYLLRKKVEKYGPEAALVDMRGKHGNHARGDSNGRWSRSRIFSEHGYVKVRVGRDHPLADPNGYAYEHLLVWISAGRRRPAANELIHHKSEDKTDNRLGNLQLITRSGHGIHHSGDRLRSKDGRFLGSVRAGPGKGGDMSQWPEDLRVREFPVAAS